MDFFSDDILLQEPQRVALEVVGFLNLHRSLKTSGDASAKYAFANDPKARGFVL